jgi:hypothetical protein
MENIHEYLYLPSLISEDPLLDDYIDNFFRFLFKF